MVLCASVYMGMPHASKRVCVCVRVCSYNVFQRFSAAQSKRLRVGQGVIAAKGCVIPPRAGLCMFEPGCV